MPTTIDLRRAWLLDHEDQKKADKITSDDVKELLTVGTLENKLRGNGGREEVEMKYLKMSKS